MAKRPAKATPKPREDHDESRPWSPDSPQHPHGRIRRKIASLEAAVTFLFELEVKIMAVDQKIVNAQNRLDAAVAQLATDVAALQAAAHSPADTDAVVAGLDASTAAVTALDASVKPTA